MTVGKKKEAAGPEHHPSPALWMANVGHGVKEAVVGVGELSPVEVRLALAR